MEACGGMELEIHVFLTSALVGGEWSALRPCRFITRGTEFSILKWPVSQICEYEVNYIQP
jgi:hypothetical protein